MLKKANQILNNKKYTECLSEIKNLEKDRKFCKHDMEHFLSVARIAMLLNTELNLHIEKELIYAAALLHDIGRGEQYKTGVRHELCSAEIAPVILGECGFTTEETEQITTAIANHRNAAICECADLNGLLYRADKLSRNCFCCRAEHECDKEAEKKILYLKY